jgi:glycine betaine/proline transport system substrate-binding protein
MKKKGETRLRKIITFLLLTIIVVILSLLGCAEKEKEPLKFSDLGWGSAHFQSELARIIAMHGYGYTVELVAGKTVGLFQANHMGEIDVYIEGWMANQQEAYDEAIASGDVVLLGVLNDDNWQSLFVVPTYVIEGDPDRGIEPMAPDLKSVEDLKKPKIIELFADPEDPGKGQILTCVPGWACEEINADQLKAYGLEEYYNLKSPGSGEALHAALYGAYQKGEPHITYNWGPEWVTGMLDVTLLEEPPYNEGVWEENHGCAYPSQNLFITAYKTFPAKAPDLVEMFGKWKIDTKTLGQALAYIEDTGGEPFDAAIWFIEEREDIWTTFIPADVAQKVKDAVAQGIVEPQGTE